MTPFSNTTFLHETLTRQFSPTHITITDDSARHAGHAASRAEGETHFTIHIVSAVFEGLSRLDRQRMVYAALQPAFDHGLHALALSTQTPTEYNP